MPVVNDNLHKKNRLLPRILIVDDEPINIKYIVNALKLDYTTLVATDGEKALKIVRSDNPPDLILLDIMMPGLNGYEVCERIKDAPQHADIPIIFITAKNSKEEEIRGLELGAIDYLTKPILVPIMKAKIKMHIELKQHRDFMEILLNKQTQQMAQQDNQYQQSHQEQQECIARYIEDIQENQKRLKLSLWGSGDELWSWHLDTGLFIRENPLPLKLPAAVTKNSVEMLRDFIHPDDFNAFEQNFNEHLTQQTEYFESSHRLRNSSKQWNWVTMRGRNTDFDEHGKPLKLSGTMKDIAHIKQAEHDLRLAAKSFESISDAIWVVDAKMDVLKINQAFTRLTGYGEQSVLGKPLNIFKDRSLQTVFQENISQEKLDKKQWQGEFWGVKKNGSNYPFELQVSIIKDDNNRVTHYVGTVSDISYRKSSEKKLQYMANYDSLTALPNRSLYIERIKHAIRIAKRQQHKVAILFLDLDNFKHINDTLGHAAGDILLREIAARISDCIRESDTVARMGGDEFTLLLDNLNSASEIECTLERLLHKVATPVSLAGHEVKVSASIGIAIYPDHGDNHKDLLRYADIAMYQAKNGGKNNAQFYTEELNKDTLFRLELENELHQLVANDELQLHYQPKLQLNNDTVQGVEVLVRWQHPIRGLLEPNLFIPLAEETGHIIKLGEAILRKACTEAKPWWDSGLITGRLSVNLSAVQLNCEDLAERIQSILDETGFSATNLDLEITETNIMADQDRAVQQMRKMKDAGIHISIDDFGTGYSSLSYLQDFPVNCLKIDRSFVSYIEKSYKDKNIVASIISLAHHLNLTVIAEGVETIEQQHILKELQCEVTQGFLFSKPLPAAELKQFLEKQTGCLPLIA